MEWISVWAIALAAGLISKLVPVEQLNSITLSLPSIGQSAKIVTHTQKTNTHLPYLSKIKVCLSVHPLFRTSKEASALNAMLILLKCTNMMQHFCLTMIIHNGYMRSSQDARFPKIGQMDKAHWTWINLWYRPRLDHWH